MRSLFKLAALLTVLLLAISANAADWPRFLGPNGDAVSSEKGISKNWSQNLPKMLWKASLNDGGYAGPSAAGGKVFIIDHQEKNDIVRALDINTGKEAWKYSYEDASDSNFGFSRSTPVVDGGKVYTLSRLGNVNCLDAKTGKKIWSRNICTDFKGKKPQWDYAMSPLVDGNKLIMVPGGSEAVVVALDKTSGKTIWACKMDDAGGYATPVKAKINGKLQYVVFAGSNLIGVDAANGAKLWNLKWETQSGVNASTPIVMDNKIFISSSYKHGSALVEITPEGAKPVYETKDMMAHFSTPILVKGFLYGTSDPAGELLCIEPNTGTVKWKQAGFEKGAGVFVDGVCLWLDGKGGDLVMLEPSPDAYKELGRFTPLGGQSWTAPIIANGKLIVRNTKEIACFSLK